ISNFINGEFVPGEDGVYMNDLSPTTGEVICTFPDSNVVDTENAIRAAKSAGIIWAATPKRKRCKYLDCVADLLEKRSEDFSKAETLDTGTVISRANNNKEFANEVLNIRVLVDHALSIMGESTAEGGTLCYSIRHSLGVVAIITSWSQALPSILRHLVPAMASGNCVVIKPSCLAPLTVHLLAKVLKDSGIPKGVVNIVYGRGEVIGRILARHHDVAAVALVGSERAAFSVTMESGPRVKRVSYELGNCHAMVVYDDVDLDELIPTVIKASFLCNAGQHPHAVNRIFVHGAVLEIFTEKLVKAIRKIKIGNPQESSTQIGPLISKEQKQTVLALIQGAINDGAKVIHGGGSPKLDSKLDRGFFVEPTVLGGFKNSMDNPINQLEVQGPVVRIIPFRSESEALSGVNVTAYGLSASIWSKDGQRAHRLAQRIRAGCVWINNWGVVSPSMPCCGARMSGNGQGGGRLLLDFYTQKTTISTQF
ncbi:predicted protein, partial [Nematostella vectensis]